MGCMAVYLLLFKGQDRDFYGSWLPEGRVLKKINTTLDRSDSTLVCLMECEGIFASDLEGLLQEGEVDFASSKTQGSPKEYSLSVERESNESLEMRFYLEEDSTWVHSIMGKQPSDCQCE